MRLALNPRARRLLRSVPRTTVYTVAELLLLSLLAIQCARLFWTFVTPVDPVGEWRSSAFKPVAPVSTALLGSFDPFFRLSGGGTPMVTSLNLKLFGVRENRATGRGSAIIATPDGVQKSFAVGEEVMPGVRLVAVTYDGVTIDRGGTREQLYLDQSQPATVVAPGTIPPSQTPSSPAFTAPPQIATVPAVQVPLPPAPSAPVLQGEIRYEPRMDSGRVTGVVSQSQRQRPGLPRDRTAAERRGDLDQRAVDQLPGSGAGAYPSVRIGRSDGGGGAWRQAGYSEGEAMKRFGIALALALATVATPASAQYVLNFRDADVRAFIEDAARVTGRTFITDSAVQGKVSVVTQRPLSRSEYFEVFFSTLRANGLVAVPSSGGAFRIQPSATAATAGGRVASRGASPNSFVTEIFRLRSGDAATMRDSIRPLISPQGSVTANRNSLIVADFADNVARVRQIIAGLDRDSAATQVVGLNNAGAREVAEALTTLGGPAGANGAPVSVVPIDSSNSIVLRGDGPTVARLAEVARDLDKRAAKGTEIRVIFLQHADAEQLLPVLQELLGQPVTRSSSSNSRRLSTQSQSEGLSARSGATTISTAASPAPATTTTSSGGGTGAGVFGNKTAIVTRFEGANALVIAAPNDVQRQMGEVIRQLDKRREQVLVEAIIVEISDTAARELGVQLLLANTKGNGPFAVTNYSNVSPNILTIAGAIASDDLRRTTTTNNGTTTTTTNVSTVADTLQEAAAQQLLGAAGGLLGFGIRSGNTLFGSILKAVESDNKSNILSTPSIMTLDNQEARILVGQEIPITTGEALSSNFDNAFRTVQRENVGITLEVKPQINAGGSIKLDLRQEVSSISGPVSADFSDLILNKREIETTITVDDGDIVGIGGLLDDNERRTIEKIPLLGDIPVLGELFKSRGRSRAKTNLMVFIRPTILRSAADAQALTEQRYGYMRQQQYIQNPDHEPSLDELMREYMGAYPPAVPQYSAPPPLDPRTYAPPGTPHNPTVPVDPMVSGTPQ